ncbi:PREDICTED: TMV resistance protein N-like [Fragaria vesca subsp. vesca]|uniref:TMV resistance protein N-like n=1 Tax=Fragaria vesca subsp. vesca TaxID=101020 RepID=UPI0002C338C7|nr:PREDICTED: TMV resistance protein N-like [Fragaria vesca subsp. vesca]
MALSTQTGSAGSAFPWKYDVFLSFRGEDTRKGFTDYLYDKLQWRGIRTFRDDPHLERGTTISQELLTAIEQSRFAIIVLSPNYATSTWCLLELSKILECMEERGSILPIFYEVESSDVRHQRRSFAEAFEKHEEKFGEGNKEVEGWRGALTKVANLAGWSSKKYRYETELIKAIVQVLWSKVHPSLTVFGSSEKLVGMDAKLEEIDVLLDKEANDVRFIGIWGMGGLGKTTLAKLVYEKISHQFEVCIFLANVREVSATHGLVYLQKQILSQMLNEENVQVWDVYRVITTIKRCFCHKAVLLVLDDVDQSEQLENLVGEKDSFGLRSRIIITTRDRQVLVTHDIEEPYELKTLNENEALKLFSGKAFRKDEPDQDYVEQSKSFVRYAGGLPLALKTLGSFLYKRSAHSWSSALQKLQQTPNRTVFEILKISFDGLDETEKKIFLDIACFHRLYNNESMIELAYSSEFCTRITIDVLVEKSLLTISSDNEIGIHDSIRDMGCEIVRQESYEDPGRRSRLWLRNDIFHVFTKNTGTEAIEGILLYLDNLEETDWNLETFSKMCKLKLLYIHNLRLSVGPKYLPNALRYLNWSRYPSKYLPPGFQPDELTELSLVFSNIDHLWNGIKYLSKLKSIDLSYSVNLTRTPDFTGTPNLEKLVFVGCTNLVKIHPSIALLKRLKIWNFRDCKSIKSLPSEVHMEFIEIFDVSGCSKLKRIPEFVGQMKRLSKLSLGGSAVEKLPSSIELLSESLVKLDLNGSVIREQPYSLFLKLQNLMVSSFVFFPRKSPHPLIPLLASLKHFSCLRELNLNDCNLCEGEIPNDISSLSSLQSLQLRGNNFVSLPASIHLLSKLRHINVRDCKRLQQLPELPVNHHLHVLADNCTSLQVFPEPSDLCPAFLFTGINCLSTVANQDASYFLYSALKRLLLEDPGLYFCFVIPGSEIPEWFKNNQSVGGSVIEKLPSDASNSKLIGFAVCALFLPPENPSADDPDILRVDWYNYSTGAQLDGFGYYIYPGFSDHLMLKILPKRLLKDTGNEVKFVFEIRSLGGTKEVKQCGSRAVYEHDMEEVISRMNQSKCNISLYEATDEQEGVMVKATQKATISTSGGSDDEYYSAEE